MPASINTAKQEQSRQSVLILIDARLSSRSSRYSAPFQDWDLPPALARLRRKLGNGDDADRRFVRVLSAVLTDGLEPVEAAVREALATGTASDDLILNILARRREPPRPLTIITSEDSALRHPPIADCARYDQLRTFDAAA